MSIHNRNITYILVLIIIILSGVSYANRNNTSFLGYNFPTLNENQLIQSGQAMGATLSDPLPSILKLNQNAQSSQIQNLIFSPTSLTNNLNVLSPNSVNDRMDRYVMNIFCSEVTNRYVKVASGSGVFLSDPTDTDGVILTNAHVARHLLDANKKCVGRTGSPTTTTHTLTLRYIPSYWLNSNNQYVIGDPDQNSTGEFDFAIIQSKRIKPIKKDATNIYSALIIPPKLKISNYDETNVLNNIYVYSYPAQQALSKNVYSALYQKKDAVQVSSVYTSPGQNIKDSLLDVTGSVYIDHGSSGGMVVSQGQSNSIIGLSSVLIKDKNPQIVRVVTMKHILATLQNDLKTINNAQTDSYVSLITDILSRKDADLSLVQILKNTKLTSVLEQYTRDTLRNLNIIR